MNRDLLVGTTSLKGLTGVEFVASDNVDPWIGLLVEGPFRGENDIIDGMPGQVANELVRDQYEFTIGPFVIKGDTPAEYLENLAGVREMFDPHNMVLIRRLDSDDDPPYVDDSCNGQYLGLSFVGTPSPTEADVILTLRNCDGEWTPDGS